MIFGYKDQKVSWIRKKNDFLKTRHIKILKFNKKIFIKGYEVEFLKANLSIGGDFLTKISSLN